MLRRTDKNNYPYDFCLQITYELVENVLKTNYSVKNTGTETMYFGLGAHPAFSTLLEAGDRFEDLRDRNRTKNDAFAHPVEKQPDRP